MGIEYTQGIGEAAFYGPKLDIQYKNVHGKEDTIITLQIDFAIAEKFKMTYVDEDGEKKTPYIIHRSSLGCYERTLAMLIEKHAGAFPLWLAPEQVRVMCLTERTTPDVLKLQKLLKSHGFRAEADVRNQKIGFKIREALTQKVPYMVVIGDRDVEAGVISVRCRKDGENKVMTADELIALLKADL